jgi:hypothetical protein
LFQLCICGFFLFKLCFHNGYLCIDHLGI